MSRTSKMDHLRLSVLDTHWPGDLLALLPELDALGYHRFWATEHHSASQSASPMIIATLAAVACPRMRVGTAGVLLNLYNPVSVAHDVRLLEVLFPGRIDLGIASAIPGGAMGVALPDGGSHSSFATKLRELVRLVRYESG